jgi:aminocarboxymuconate-semialdehyde decarboxylase
MSPVIDVHAHALILEVAQLVQDTEAFAAEQAAQSAQFGVESTELNNRRFKEDWLQPLTDLDTRLSRMDSSGVDVQAVSVNPTQNHYWADAALARDIVETANSRLAEMVSAAPHRLVGLGTVALQHPGLAAEQLRRADRLGLRGVQISTTAGGRDLSDRDFDEFWSCAADLGALVFVHPAGCAFGDRLSSFYLGNIIGQPLETTVALSHLIFGGALDRHPNLRICGAHGGGFLPQYLGRADHAFETRPECRTMSRRPSEYVRNMYFDSLVYRSDTLRQLISVAGADRVLLGTDYPFDMGVDDPLARLGELDAVDRAAVAGGNAAELLRIEQSP